MPPRLVAGLGGPAASKVLKKERIIQALSRMNDRDTQKAAAEDLLSIVVNMDQEGLLIILSCLCSTGSEHKVFARKECARAIGIIASEACPLREQALQLPHLGKMLGQLRRSLQDPDGGVREASSESLALVAQGLAHVEANGAQGSLANPVVRLIFDCLAEQKRELNAAACTALGMAAPFLGTLDASLARELVRKLNSPSFQAPAALLAAMARSDPATGEPVGLMKSGPAAFVPLLSTLVGQPAPPATGAGSPGFVVGSGVAGALSRPDWPVRLAAADMLRATATLLGPLLEHDGCWNRSDAKSISGRAIRALESCKFDKVRDVRDVARNALSVLEELHAYGSGGGTLQGWPEHIARKLYGPDLQPPVVTSTFVLPSFAVGGGGGGGGAAVAASTSGPPVSGRKSPGRRSSAAAAAAAVTPGRRPYSAQPPGPRASAPSPPRASRSPTPAERRSSPILARGGSVSERFRAAHRDVDVVSVHYLGAVASEPLPLPGSIGEESDSGAVQPQPQPQPQLQLVEPEPMALEGSAGPSLARGPTQDDTLPDVAASSNRRTSRQPSKQTSSSGRTADRPLPMESLMEPQQAPAAGASFMGVADALLLNLTLEDDAAAVLDSDAEPTFSPHRVTELPSASELTAWAAAAAAAHLQSGLDPAVLCTAMAPGTAARPSLTPPLPHAAAASAAVSIPVEEWAAAQQRLRSLEEQQRQLLEAFSSMSEQNRQTIAGLEAKVRSLEEALETAQSQMASQQPQIHHPQQQQELQQQGCRDDEELLQAEAEVSWAARTIRPGSPLMPLFTRCGTTADGCGGASTALDRAEAEAAPAPALAAAAAANPTGPASDVQQAYREVLAAGRLSDMHLLRLMQRTGPNWGDLGPELSARLLAAFTASLQQARADGPLLSRVMPWLWRLADEENTVFEAPVEMRAPLLTALRNAQAAVTDPMLFDRVGLLVSTLRTHWSLPDVPHIAGGQRAHPLPQPQSQPQPHYQAQLPSAPFPQGIHGGDVPQELSFAAGVARAVLAPRLGPPGAGITASGSGGNGCGITSENSRTTTTTAAVLQPIESQSPVVVDATGTSAATPRVSMVRSSQAGRSPSIGTLMGQWSDLQRDFAAMSSPSQRPLSRGQG